MKKSVRQYIKKRVEKELDSLMEYLRNSALTKQIVKKCVLKPSKDQGGYLIHPKAWYLSKCLRKGIALKIKKLGSKT